MLSAQLLTILCDWYRAARPTAWLFPGLIPGSHVTREGINDACQLGVKRSGLCKPVTPHALCMKVIRGCFEPSIAHMTAKRPRVGHYGDRKPRREPETEAIRFTTP